VDFSTAASQTDLVFTSFPFIRKPILYRKCEKTVDFQVSSLIHILFHFTYYLPYTVDLE
jgi:hypothetical protein